MAEVADSHDMDAYLVNPTLKMDADYANSTPRDMAGHFIPIFASDEIYTIKTGNKIVEQTATIRKLPDEPNFTHGYNSEEEAASPTEDDEEDFYSLTDTDSNSSGSIKLSPSLEDLLDEIYDNHVSAAQLCTKAQAVQFVSAGQAKVVSVPKRIEIPARGSSLKSRNEPNLNQKASLDNTFRTNSTRSSSESSTAWNPSLRQPQDQKTLRRKPNLPLLQPLLTPSPQRAAKARAQTPLSQQRADFVKPVPMSSNWPLGSPTTPQSAKRKPSKLLPSLKLKGSGRSRRSNSTDTSSTEDSPTNFEFYGLPNTPSNLTVQRNFSKPDRKPMPKLVARGASEREAAIILPPCPYDYDDANDDNIADDYGEDYEIRYATAWPLREDPALDSTGALKQLRRKSVSAAVVTSQA